MRALTAVAAVIAVVTGVAACGSSSTGSTKSSTVRLAFGKDKVTVRPGEFLSVGFKTEPGVGFDWSLASNRPRGIVLLHGVRSVAAKPGTIGGSETKTYTFEGNHGGAAVLTFHHSFRGKPRGERTVRVTVSG